MKPLPRKIFIRNYRKSPAVDTVRPKPFFSPFVHGSLSPENHQPPNYLGTDSDAFNTKPTTMSNLLYLIAVILIIAWAIGFLGFHIGGGLIHILLVIAVIAVILRLIRGDRVL